MRVITGSARGRRLKTLDGQDVRPTTDRVKEAIFSILQWELPAASVLDLFAGSGQLGIEALSRGAGHCVFVDVSRDSVAVVRENLQATHLMEQATLLTTDAISYLKHCNRSFDIVLLDPPYESTLLNQALSLLSPFLSAQGVIVCETTLHHDFAKKIDELCLQKEYRYGKIKLGVYRLEDIS